MIPGMEMLACQNLAVPAEVMQHVVNVESSRNPFAIGVVGGQLVRQPKNLDEAVATVLKLEDGGYNYSVGAAQVNRANLGKYGLDTFEKAFEFCPNLVAGSRILGQCYTNAGNDWGKAFSCYYSGNFTTGYRHGYVQKIFASMARSSAVSASRAIPLQTTRIPARIVKVGNGATGITTDGPAYRVAMRSVDDAAAAVAIGPAIADVAGVERPTRLVAMQDRPITNPALMQNAEPAAGPIRTDAATAAAMSQIGAQVPANMPAQQPGRIQTDPTTAAAMSQIGVSPASPTGAQAAPSIGDDGSIFVPQVRGLGEPASIAQPQAPARPATDNADLRAKTGDDAFVF